MLQNSVVCLCIMVPLCTAISLLPKNALILNISYYVDWTGGAPIRGSSIKYAQCPAPNQISSLGVSALAVRSLLAARLRPELLLVSN